MVEHELTDEITLDRIPSQCTSMAVTEVEPDDENSSDVTSM